jgi:hypothetical protein
MKSAFKIVLALVAVVVLGLVAGYYFGFIDSAHAPVNQDPRAESFDGLRMQMREKMIGTWRSQQDAKFTREFRADGTVGDRYEGSAVDANGTWMFVLDASKEPIQLPAVAGLTILKITMGEAMYFAIQEVTDSELQLMGLTNGGMQVYTRM